MQTYYELEAPLNIPMESSGDEYEGPTAIDDVSDIGDGGAVTEDEEDQISPMNENQLVTGRLRSHQPEHFGRSDNNMSIDNYIETSTALIRKTKRQKAKSFVPDDLEDFIQDDEEEFESRPKRKRGTSSKKIVLSEDSDQFEESIAPIVAHKEFNPRQIPKTSKTKITKTKIRQSDMKWLLESSSIWTPYRPQIGDIIYYIKAGHVQFAETVSPFIKIYVDHELPEVLLCKVLEIQYQMLPTLVCDITVGVYPFLDFPENEDRDQFENLPSLTIRFFYHENSPDFLILYSLFQDSLSQGLKMGDCVKLRYELDNNITAQVLVVNEESLTPWNRYQIDFQEVEKIENFNPWELTSLKGTFSGLPKLDVLERDRLLRVIDNALKDPLLEPFFNHVFNEIESYLDSVVYPLCIRLINARLKNDYYRNTAHVLWGKRFSKTT